MTRWLIALIALGMLVIFWLTQRQRRAADMSLIASGQRLAESRLAERAPQRVTPSTPPASPDPDPRSTFTSNFGPLQEATDVATGQEYAQAAEQLTSLRSELAEALREVEEAATQQTAATEETLAHIQAGHLAEAPAGTSEAIVAEGVAAADEEPDAVPAGAVRGDGSRDCPAAYPIKGNQNSMLYHEPDSRSYGVTIPEFCFDTAESAEAAGFSAPKRG